MNERVKELREQAREYARQYVAHCRTYGYFMEYNEEQTQFENKLAELIVRECANFTDHAEELLKHFGVEE